MSARFSLLCATLLASVPNFALAETYEVGPDKPYATIQETLELLKPGDVVEVQGKHSYPGDLWFRAEQSGTPGDPVTIRGIKVDGKRPIIQGVGTEQWHDMVVLLNASHFVFEGFEIIGDENPDHFGLVHKADDVTLRDLVVHDVAGQGLLGTDTESGSLTLENSEFYSNGTGLYQHQVYVATDETMYPGSVFRMQHCYIHDGTGGNNVKSRAERNEIYYNWIEGAVYHELDLIGPDGQDQALAREDSDVVGNVFIKHSAYRIARIGGDGTGNTAGRYRFVNNTIVLGAESDVAFGLQQTVETLELHNNVIVRVGASGGSVWDHNEPEGPAPLLFGSNNWIQDDFTAIADEFTGTLRGAKPGFTDLDAFDFRPVKTSALLDQGTGETSIADPAFPKALALPRFVPPARSLGTKDDRPESGPLDIGAFELGSGDDPGPGGPGPGRQNDGVGEPDGCACRTAAPTSSRASAFLLFGVSLLLSRLRRKRS